MISRVARNDVVRLRKNGEVGLVKGWADHEKLANGTIIDVDMGGGRTIQGDGNAFDYVARAKPVWSTVKRVYWGIATWVTMAWGAYFGWRIASHGVDVTGSAFAGFSAHFFAYYSLKGMTIYSRRTRITLPKPVPRQVRPPQVSREEWQAGLNKSTRR